MNRHWCIDYEELLSEIIASLLISKYPQNSPTKRKRTLKSNSQSNGAPSAEQVNESKISCQKINSQFLSPFLVTKLLGHLEHLRQSCRYGHSAGTALYLHEKMQRALQQAFSHSTEGQKVKEKNFKKEKTVFGFRFSGFTEKFPFHEICSGKWKFFKKC